MTSSGASYMGIQTGLALYDQFGKGESLWPLWPAAAFLGLCILLGIIAAVWGNK